MTHANYKKWLQEKFIPNLVSKSVIVVDNASYHNTQINRHPTSNARKGEILFCLVKHGIRYSSDMTKAGLYCITGTGLNPIAVDKYIIPYHNSGKN